MTARVLVVCTANVCRSPMAAALLSHHLAQVDADVTVRSAGTRATDLAVDPDVVRALDELGVPLVGHAPRRVDRAIITGDGADLVITMTREHLRQVATTCPDAWPRTFTLRELVRRAADSSRSAPHELRSDVITQLDSWVLGMSFGRRAAELMGSDEHDDTADPHGMGVDAVRRTAADLDRATRLLAGVAPWPRRSAPAPH